MVTSERLDILLVTLAPVLVAGEGAIRAMTRRSKAS